MTSYFIVGAPIALQTIGDKVPFDKNHNKINNNKGQGVDCHAELSNARERLKLLEGDGHQNKAVVFAPLHAFRPGSRQLAHQIWVLGPALTIAAPAGVPVDVNDRAPAVQTWQQREQPRVTRRGTHDQREGVCRRADVQTRGACGEAVERAGHTNLRRCARYQPTAG